MSGGSYDYLCVASLGELFDSGKAEMLERMRDALSGHPDAARETEAIARRLSDFEKEMRARLECIAPLWKAVEWHDSGDWSAKAVEEAAADWRKNGPAPDVDAPCDLHALVDWSSLDTSEGHVWPSTRTATELIALARRRRPTQKDADRLKAGESLREIAATEIETGS